MTTEFAHASTDYCLHCVQNSGTIQSPIVLLCNQWLSDLEWQGFSAYPHEALGSD